LSLGRFVLQISHLLSTAQAGEVNAGSSLTDHPMDKKRVDRFKKLLLARREELLRSIAQTQEEGRTMQQSYGPDEGDRANSSLDKELLFHQTTHARGLLGAIDAALARMGDGTFGQCMVCSEEIGPKRLEALPWTRYCIACQESAEKKR
jgi:DnaK suppressor protein